MARQNHKKFMRRYRWQSGACLDCGKLYSETELTRHHLVPKSKGGTDGGENIVLLCVPCHDARHTANAALRGGEAVPSNGVVGQEVNP